MQFQIDFRVFKKKVALRRERMLFGNVSDQNKAEILNASDCAYVFVWPDHADSAAD